ncbi:transfer protein spdA [Streptomyces sp. NBC_01617]|uniref:transfer protein spdA n=1 Tax=Streptomyces sp. NBC_01617 TaxID=2975899 RepID=UPI003867759E|nr:transfer protein spdA [Streptomyces sp. NBC_01617]
MTRNSVADYARHAALLASMAISFVTQQHLAVTHGVPQLPSYAVPLAIDLYLVWAVRTRRDVALAVLVSVAANVAGVLTAESLASVDTWVSAGLHAVFPVTLYRMHRPWVAAKAPLVADPVPAVSAPAIAPPVPAETPPDKWPDADLWADFEDSAPDVEPVTPPSVADVRTVIAELGGQATGVQLARHYGVSDRTGRRYLQMASEAA